MIQANDKATFNGQVVTVIKINPHSRTAKISIDGEIRTVPYASLTPIKENSYHVKKSPAELLKDFAVEIQGVYEYCLKEIELINNMNNPSNEMLVRRGTFSEIADILNGKLQGK